MKYNILSVFAIFIMLSCQNKDKTDSKNIVKAIAKDTLLKTVTKTADLSEVSPKDDKAIEMIRKQLQVLLEKDLPIITKDQRYFYYDVYDLNNDQKNEYFVGFSNSFFLWIWRMLRLHSK